MSVGIYIKENVYDVGENVFCAPEIPEKKLNNAISSIAQGLNPEYVIAIVDTTLFGSAKEGIVFSGDRVYIRNTFEKAQVYKFEEISSAEYISDEIKKDNGKIEKKEDVYFKFNNGNGTRVSLPSANINYEKFTQFINGILREGGEDKNFETKSQILPLSEMDDEIKTTYIKIICNYCYSNDNIIDAKEYAEVISLIVRIEYNSKNRIGIRSYMCDSANKEDTKILIKNLYDNISDSSIDIVKKSLIKDIIYIFKLNNNLDEWRNDEFITELQKELDIKDEQIELILSVIKNDEDILKNRKNDSEIAKSLKEIGAKAVAAGVPLAAIYFSGSVIGMSAAGMTSGLAALGMGGALGFSSMFTGIGMVALIGVGTYKGVKKITGLSELENNKQREFMLQEIIKNSQKSLNYLIEDVNEISQQLMKEINKGLETSKKIEKLARILGMMSKGAKEANVKINFAETESIIAKLPRTLDKIRLEELTNEPTKEKLRVFVLSCYIEKDISMKENNSNALDKESEISSETKLELYSGNSIETKKVLALKDKLSLATLEQLHNILDSIGYMNLKDVTIASAKGVAKNFVKNFMS